LENILHISNLNNSDSTTSITNVARTLHSKSAKIRRFLWRFEHNETDIEDIVQDAMLAAIKCKDNFEARSTGETWFFGIAKNMARHHVAKRTLENSRYISGEFPAESAQVASCPTDSIELKQLSAQLIEALRRIPRDLSETFDLACLQEHPYAEVADLLSIPIGTVRSRVNRARMLIRKEIELMNRPALGVHRAHAVVLSH
jgi:RNA polymerase sigma factor (sigma-70 family)